MISCMSRGMARRRRERRPGLPGAFSMPPDDRSPARGSRSGNVTPMDAITMCGTAMPAGRATRIFQGFGQTTSDGEGGYKFLTIRPVAYTGRTPHIHFVVAAPGQRRLVTQMYVAGEPQNERAGVLLGVRDPAARSRLIAPVQPAPEIGA